MPVTNITTTLAILLRIPRNVLLELGNKWPRIINTQPPVKPNISQRQWNKQVLQQFAMLKDQKSSKRTVIAKIIELWPQGLNLLQLSQLDCQLIVDKPNTFSWILSIVKDSKGKEILLHLDPKKLLASLARDLNYVFMSHIYVCKHPKLPIIILRIQVFDLGHITGPKPKSTRPHIVSNKAFFVAIPLGSPYIIHTPRKDLVSDIVMQVVEQNLPQTPSNLLAIETDFKQKPVRSLEAMNYLHDTRFAHSFGAWMPYADASIDISPLETLDNHGSMQPHQPLEASGSLNRLEQVANLRFKGYMSSDEAPKRKRKRELEGFESLAPIQDAEFVIKYKFSDNTYSHITLKLRGTDVFAGLHELSTQTTVQQDMIVDVEQMPSWLTGQEGRSCGTVVDGVFLANKR